MKLPFQKLRLLTPFTPHLHRFSARNGIESTRHESGLFKPEDGMADLCIGRLNFPTIRSQSLCISTKN
ncbi:hypothetical protein I312_105181 [Cryptococcus bacillisporus CA1280]|uniref:uncharacterized protein n=1 Tax=Cryptococcus bacillisporus CA1280 TaxID=1296109 RepID=UPI003367D771